MTACEAAGYQIDDNLGAIMLLCSMTGGVSGGVIGGLTNSCTKERSSFPDDATRLKF